MPVQRHYEVNSASGAHNTSSLDDVQHACMNGSTKINHANGHTAATGGAPNLGAVNCITSDKGSGGFSKNDIEFVCESSDDAHHSDGPASTHSLLVSNLFKKLQDILYIGSVKINGDDLDISTVVAVSRYVLNASPFIGLQNRL